MAIDTTSPRSRRAILIGAAGGAVAAAVSATMGRASSVSAADGDTVQVGGTYAATRATEIDVTDNAIAIHGTSTSNTGIVGDSDSGDGVDGTSKTGFGVFGNSLQSYAVLGMGGGPAAIYGHSENDATGILGYSGDVVWAPVAPVKTGVFGYADQTAASVGVRGQSPKGRGVVAIGGAAQLRLVPSAAATHPGRGAMGDLFVDSSGRLWFCKGGLGVRTWKQIA